MFERRDIWELSEEKTWHPIIESYARAVGAMQGRDGTDFSDPTSWRYLANIHGVDLEELPRRSWPRGATWRECQHSSWFFLPWHRIYLHYFEQVVRQTIVDLGGPDDWALPYWNYSDPERENVRRLPPAFREQQMPSGDPNPLFVSQRRTTPFNINEGDKIPPRFEDEIDPTPALTTPFFSTRDMDPDPVTEVLARGFGGPRTGWNWFGGTPGLLEDRPHNWVHGLVGGWRRGDVGWMSDSTTAARDPIFWLHHANIDRLWEAWLALGDPDDPDNRDFRNPSATRWRNMWFKVGGGASAVTLSVREVLDTTRPPLNYRYSNISVPSVPAPAPAAVLAASPDTEESIPEMVGASESRTPLAATATEVEVAVGAPSGPAFRGRAEGAQPRKVYLQVKNVRGKEPVAVGYLVYVNLPPGADPTTDPTTYEDRRVGQIAMFGVREASEPDVEHSGSGLTLSFDITDVYMRLQEMGEWDPERLRVTFAPVLPEAEQGGDVRAGQVSLFYA